MVQLFLTFLFYMPTINNLEKNGLDLPWNKRRIEQAPLSADCIKAYWKHTQLKLTFGVIDIGTSASLQIRMKSLVCSFVTRFGACGHKRKEGARSFLKLMLAWERSMYPLCFCVRMLWNVSQTITLVTSSWLAVRSSGFKPFPLVLRHLTTSLSSRKWQAQQRRRSA